MKKEQWKNIQSMNGIRACLLKNKTKGKRRHPQVPFPGKWIMSHWIWMPFQKAQPAPSQDLQN